MAVPIHNSRIPFLDTAAIPPPIPPPIKRAPDLLIVANHGIALVAHTTKYLSTLPQPIEIVEELIAVCAVTSTLLTTLHATIERFPHLALFTTHSFIVLLCQDVLFGFRLLGSKVEEARRRGVFEVSTSDKGGVLGVPRVAWAMVCGGEERVQGLRSRLYVEKYRVRVLIEAVCWRGLVVLDGKSERQGRELEGLEAMLSLVAERMVGIQRDYVPRLKALRGEAPPPQYESGLKSVPVTMTPEVKAEQTKPVAALREQRNFISEKEQLNLADSEISIYSNSSTSSLTSSTDDDDNDNDSIHEIWLLRHQPRRISTIIRTHVLGLPVKSTQTLSPAYYYVKPVSAFTDEIHDMIKQCQGKLNEQEHRRQFEGIVLGMEEGAQCEIEKLVRAREEACQGAGEWGVVAGMERKRRAINNGCNRSWKSKIGMGKKEPVEWVLVLRGRLTTTDTQRKVLPVKHADPWKPAPVHKAPVQIQCQQGPCQQAQYQQVRQLQVQQQQQQQQQVVRHLEQKKVMSAGEARVKMEEIVGELFVLKV